VVVRCGTAGAGDEEPQNGQEIQIDEEKLMITSGLHSLVMRSTTQPLRRKRSGSGGGSSVLRRLESF